MDCDGGGLFVAASSHKPVQREAPAKPRVSSPIILVRRKKKQANSESRAAHSEGHPLPALKARPPVREETFALTTRLDNKTAATPPRRRHSLKTHSTLHQSDSEEIPSTRLAQQETSPYSKPPITLPAPKRKKSDHKLPKIKSDSRIPPPEEHRNIPTQDGAIRAQRSRTQRAEIYALNAIARQIEEDRFREFMDFRAAHPDMHCDPGPPGSDSEAEDAS
eukprot:m.43040 g.43040  ORF g.43040 m.43040 type:complete len:220 (+) comp10723_c0_seq2:151-810(+)